MTIKDSTENISKLAPLHKQTVLSVFGLLINIFLHYVILILKFLKMIFKDKKK